MTKTSKSTFEGNTRCHLSYQKEMSNLSSGQASAALRGVQTWGQRTADNCKATLDLFGMKHQRFPGLQNADATKR